MPKKSLVIIIPTHRPNINNNEKISLTHLKKYLNKYDTYFVIPRNINAKVFKSFGYKIKKVDNNFFGTLRRANEMYLNRKFYEEFKNYDFMLIYQLDALVFSNKIERWIKSGYDFIAAPLFRPIIGYLSHKPGQSIYGGNGGFSLRNIKKSIKILEIVNKSATRSSKNLLVRLSWFLLALLQGKTHKIWLQAPADNYPFNEDGFWSYEAVKYYPQFRVAPFKDGLKFSFERFPAKCFKLNNYQLPFGCHAWTKYDRKFWEKYLLV